MEIPKKDYPKLLKIAGMLKATGGEGENARAMLNEFLEKRGLVWNDLWEIPGMADILGSELPEHNVLELITGLLDKYIWVSPEERLAIGLWVLHTHVHHKFGVTPRLALLSPVFGCGKTTLLILLERLVSFASRYDNVSAALVYRQIDEDTSPTILLDEANHQNLLQNGVLRVVLNANRHGSKIGRAVGKGIKSYKTFTPIAIAAMGVLPNDLTQRSITINMQRMPIDQPPLSKLNELDPEFNRILRLMRIEIQKWAETAKLEPNPPTPLQNRRADNWRVLLSIADNLGVGAEAREAAVKLSIGLPDEDLKVYLLDAIRDVFASFDIDRISTRMLLDELHMLESGLWIHWTGQNNEKPPHPLTNHELASLLRGFKIRAHTVYPRGSRKTRGSSAQGFYRADFESAWSSYCP
jgi:hypothetical protein